MTMSFQSKLAAAASGTGAVAAGAAEAKLVYVDNRPIEINVSDVASGSAPGIVNWDIDGGNGIEFRLVALWAQFSTVSVANGFGTRWRSSAAVALTNWYSWENTGGLVQKASSTGIGVQALANGATVGPTMANYGINSAKTVRGVFDHYTVRQVTQTWTCGTGTPHFDPACAPVFPKYPGGRTETRTYWTSAFSPENGFHEGDNFLGFGFDDTAGAHYGWAVINLDQTRPWGVAITSWAYETTPNAAVKVGEVPSEVPAPPAAISGLTTLALGAAGIRRLRKKKASGRSAKAA